LKLLLDQGVPRAGAARLRAAGWDVVHVGELGMAAAKDAEILKAAEDLSAGIATLDADFHGLLALSGASAPSVIRLRLQGLQTDALVNLLLSIAPQIADAVAAGSMITVNRRTVRIHRLPLTRSSDAES
jgi:predicted nuclease of predicted toxin-antitoxin system